MAMSSRLWVLAIAALVLAFGGLAQPRSADAAPISRNNPYRTYNLSGINYGSMQWERTHNRRPQTFRLGRRR